MNWIIKLHHLSSRPYPYSPSALEPYIYMTPLLRANAIILWMEGTYAAHVLSFFRDNPRTEGGDRVFIASDGWSIDTAVISGLLYILWDRVWSMSDALHLTFSKFNLSSPLNLQNTMTYWMGSLLASSPTMPTTLPYLRPLVTSVKPFYPVNSTPFWKFENRPRAFFGVCGFQASPALDLQLRYNISAVPHPGISSYGV